MSESIRSYRDLKVWQLAMEIAELAYDMTRPFPTEEKYGIVSQIRRAATSVPAKIAEGHGRASTKDYLRFLSIAIGSLCELETFLELSVRLKSVNGKSIEKLLGLISAEGRMIRGLQKSLRAKLRESR